MPATPQENTFTAPKPDQIESQIPTLSGATIKIYTACYKRAVVNGIVSRMRSEDDHVDLTADNLVEDYLSTRDKFAPQTSNIMRAALLWGMGPDKRHGWENAKERLASIAPTPMSAKRAELEGEEVSFQKVRKSKRMIPEDHFDRLINGLSSRGRSGMQAQYLLLAGVATGARPFEWINAVWADEEKTILRIYNAKVKARNAWAKIPPMTFTAENLDGDTEQPLTRQTQPNGVNPVQHPNHYDIDFERRIASLDLSEEERDELRQAKYLKGVTLFRDVPVKPSSRNYVTIQMAYVAGALQAAREKAQAKVTPKRPMPDDYTLFGTGYFSQTRAAI